jgi:hypothetical protein
MKQTLKLIFPLLLLIGLSGYSQNNPSILFLQDDFGGYQFYEEMVETLNLARARKIETVEFRLKEYLNENDTLKINFSTLNCQFTSDSTLMVTKHYTDGSQCFLWKYEFIITHNIYILKSTLQLPENQIEEYKCEDTNKKYDQLFKSNWKTYSSNDSTIVAVSKISYRTNGSILKQIIDFDSNMYYLDSEDRCIGIDSDLKIEYFNKDSAVYSRNLVGFSMKTTEFRSKVQHSASKYVLNTTQHIKYSDSESIDESTSSIEYSLNDKQLPIKIEVLKSNNDPHKIKESTMTIIYKN